MVLDTFQLDHHAVEHYGDNNIDDTFRLPGAHPLSALMLEWDLEDSAANVASVIDSIDVEIAGESLFSGLDGSTMRNLIEWWRGRAEAAPADGLTETHRLYIPFGRFPQDPNFMLPAHEFNARLKFQGSHGGADTLNALRVYVEQAFQVPDQIVTPKVSRPDDVTVGGGEDWQVQGNPGRSLASLFLQAGNTDIVDGGRMQVHNNNRQETVYEIERDVHQVWMLQERQIRDDVVDDTFLAFPYDRQRTLKTAVPTGRNKVLRDFRVEGSAASGAAQADVELLQEDYVVL